VLFKRKLKNFFIKARAEMHILYKLFKEKIPRLKKEETPQGL